MPVLQQLGENPHPISEQNFFDVFAAKSTVDQFSREVSSLRMVRQVGNKMRPCELRCYLLLLRLGPLAIKEFKEIETDPHAVNPNQAGDMLNMIDIPVERRLLLAWTHEHGIDPDDAAPFTNHPDLFVTRIAFDVVIPPRIAVGH